FILPIARQVMQPRPHGAVVGRRMGRKIAGVNPWIGARNSGGRTPTTVHWLPLSVTWLPITERSDPNRRAHRAWLIITTGGAAASSSAIENSRPNSGAVPSIEK